MKRSIIHVLHVGNDLGTVTNALSTLKGLTGWWTKDVSGSTEEGGVIEFRFADVFKPYMKVLKSEDGIVQWQCVDGEDEWKNDLFTFNIQDNGKSVRLTFTQEYSNEITDEQYGTYNFNWGYYLNSMKRYCETGEGTPWFNRL